MKPPEQVKVIFTADLHAFRPVIPPRTLHRRELEVIGLLLSKPFPLRDAVHDDVQSALITEECQHCPSLVWGAWGHTQIVFEGEPVSGAVPFHLIGTDETGLEIDVVLHLTQGHVDTLEVNRADGRVVERLPETNSFTVWPLGSYPGIEDGAPTDRVH